MESKPFGWCFIGTGTLAHNVAKEIVPSGRHRIVSTYSRNLEKNKAFAEPLGAIPAKSIEEAVDADGVDAVYVVTPHPAHFAAVKTAMEHGKPVLCEKPMNITAAQAEELFALAKQKQLYLTEAMWTWFAPTANRIKEWYDTGRYGTVQRVVMNYHMNGKGYAPRVTDPKQGGGALLDIGVYTIHYLIRLFGKPVMVHCEGRLRDGIDWGEEIDLTFANGLTVRASVSIDDFRGLERFAIYGSEACTSVWLFHMANSAKLKKGLKTFDRIKAYGGMLNEFDLVSQEIRSGLTESRFVPPEATVTTLQIVDECRKQMGLRYPFETK